MGKILRGPAPPGSYAYAKSLADATQKRLSTVYAEICKLTLLECNHLLQGYVQAA